MPLATYLVVSSVEIRREMVVAGAAVENAAGFGEGSGCSPIVANKSFTFGRITGVAPGAAENGFAAAL